MNWACFLQVSATWCDGVYSTEDPGIFPTWRTFMLSLLELSAFLAGMVNDLPPRVNYIFVDFENVHETDLDRIAQKPVKVTLVLGEQHKKLPVSLVQETSPVCRPSAVGGDRS